MKTRDEFEGFDPGRNFKENGTFALSVHNIKLKTIINNALILVSLKDEYLKYIFHKTFHEPKLMVCGKIELS